jgi:hypothetical protein
LWESTDEEDEEDDDEDEEDEEDDEDEDDDERRRGRGRGLRGRGRGGRGARFNARPPLDGGGRFHPYDGIKHGPSERCEECGKIKRNGPDKPLCYRCWQVSQ